jgi:glycosyltransferase involved in cell wall biosynthesis
VRPGDEVIVVDSASRGDETRRLAAASGARYVRCNAAGASLARNAGWRAASNDVVAFVDDDVQVFPDWADALAASIEGHPSAAFVTGRCDQPPGFEFVSRPVAVKKDPDPAVFTAGTREMTIGHGANLAVRRFALEAVGGFDETLGPGTSYRAAEDVDLFDRLLGAGFLGRYDPSVGAWHAQWRNRRQLIRLDWGYGIGSGARVVKLLRTDRARGRIAAWNFFWGWGMRYVLRAAVDRRPFLFTTSLARVFGGVVGAGRVLVRSPWPTPAGDGAACRPPPRAGSR